MVPVGHVSGRPPDRLLVSLGPPRSGAPKGTHTKVLSRGAPRSDDLQARSGSCPNTPLPVNMTYWGYRDTGAGIVVTKRSYG
jgi:hypothetical protein